MAERQRESGETERDRETEWLRDKERVERQRETERQSG